MERSWNKNKKSKLWKKLMNYGHRWEMLLKNRDIVLDNEQNSKIKVLRHKF